MDFLMTSATQEIWKQGLALIAEGKVVETDKETYYWFLECLPPLKMSSSGYLNSEPSCHNKAGQAVYYCGWENKGKYYGCHATLQQFNAREPLKRQQN